MNLKFRKVLALVMTLVLLLGNVNIAFAEQVEDAEAPAESSEIIVPQEEPEVEEGFSQMYGKVYITGQKNGRTITIPAVSVRIPSP